ncbi:MAG: M23 family metallopeptidase [Myxococcota bacterium]
MLALGLVNYLLFFGQETGVAPPTLEERLQRPASAPSDEAAEEPGGSQGRDDGAAPAPDFEDGRPVDDFGEPIGHEVAGEIRRGQTILKSLKSQGIDNRTALPLIHAMEEVFDFRHAQVGDDFVAWLDDEGRIQRFRYVQSPLDVYEVDLEDGGRYAARKVEVPTRVEVAKVGCAIKNSLYGSVARCGEGPQLGTRFIDLFAWDVDFFQDVRQGDEFRVLVEKISVDGNFLKYGRILAAEYDGKFGRHRIVHYTDPEGNSGYFTDSGRAVRKDFLKSPLKYTRVSARGNSGIRARLKKASPVVYTAGEGTPVWAVASGTVAFAGESGSLGNTVTIRHDNGYTSTYGHLEDLSEHIEVGALVNQKTVIGQVGTSGRADEPKLMFSLRKNGRLVNPLKMKFSEADPVPARFREHFGHQVHTLLEDLESTPVIGIHERRS